MDKPNFTISNLPEENLEKNIADECRNNVLDFSQIDNLKLSLSISDGFKFGLGLILSCIVFSIIVFFLSTFGLLVGFLSLNKALNALY